MVHYYLHWTDHGANEISLWVFSVKHDVWLHNHLQHYHYGITQIELLTRNKADHRDLSRSNLWGCPVFVLETKLKNYQMITK